MDDLTKFINIYCPGRNYDSCVNSPCQHSSSNGCSHPEHPKFNADPCPFCGDIECENAECEDDY